MSDETTPMSPSGLAATAEVDRQRVLDWRDKAVQPSWYGRTTAQVAAASPALDTLSTPMMTLDRQAIAGNLAAMGGWCAAKGVSLAPHGKTTMAPELWRQQVEAGAWAISVANEPQLRVARGAGVPRVIVANLLLRPEALTWLSAELDTDDGFEFFCWVDSTEAVRIMDTVLRSARARRQVAVLIELGTPGARTGARSQEEALEVAEAVLAAPTLALAGVAGFEASAARAPDEAGLAAVDGFLAGMVRLHRALLGRYEVDEALLSAGGSLYFDHVVAALGPERGNHDGTSTRVVLRSGAYIVHDDGFYRGANPQSRGAGPTLRPAMHVWARVISIPEPGLALLDAGKRDVPYDKDLPELQVVRRRDDSGSSYSLSLDGHELFATNDQHSYVRLPAESPLRVGDMVRLGLSHPCTAFDKWSLIAVLDSSSADDPMVVDLVRTYF